MRRAVTAAFLAIVATAVPARAELRVSMHDGLVTVSASDVTVRQILAEWARVGQTKIVNGERVSGGPVTLEITDMPEEQALDILLRSAAGYLAAPRPVPIPSASHFDRIVITPTSSPASAPIAAGRPSPQPQPFARPPAPFINGADDNAPAPPLPQATPGNPVPNPFPPPGAASGQPAPSAPQAPTATPSTPGGMSMPGTVMPAPPSAPGQPGSINPPGQQPQRQ